MEWPSGDQKKSEAPSELGRGCDSPDAKLYIRTLGLPESVRNTNFSPSGEIRKSRTPSGMTSGNWMTRSETTGEWERKSERAAAGQQFIKHAAERENIATRVGFLALDLFRRHVLQRAGYGSYLCHAVCGAVFGSGLTGLIHLCEAKIEELHSRFSQQDIGRFQV